MTIKIKFGKYKGSDVSSLPKSYCKWLVTNTKLYGGLRDAVYARLGLRPPPQLVFVPRPPDETIDYEAEVDKLITYKKPPHGETA